MGVEPMTCCLENNGSTTELLPQVGAYHPRIVRSHARLHGSPVDSGYTELGRTIHLGHFGPIIHNNRDWSKLSKVCKVPSIIS